MKNWILVLALLSLATSGGARKHKDDSPAKSEENGITIEYDRFRDTTTVHSAWLRLPPASKWNGLGSFSLAAFYTCPGDTARCKPEIVWLTFSANGLEGKRSRWLIPGSDYEDRLRRGWRWIDFHDVVILADGERCAPGKIEWDGNSQSVTEFVIAFYNSAQFLKILDAAEVQGRIGTEEFRIKDHNRAKLEAFGKVLRSGSSEP